ncbi:MAG: peptidase C11 [Clostridia bacterium]|nr:peptidase C11 [Clostridia bacterium]
MTNRPEGHARETNGTVSVGRRRGSGLGTGPVGNTSRPSGGAGGPGGGTGGGGGPHRSSGGGSRGPGGKSSLLIIVALIAALLLGGGGLGGLFGGGDNGSGGQSGGTGSSGGLLGGGSSGGSLGGLLGGGSSGGGLDVSGILGSLGLFGSSGSSGASVPAEPSVPFQQTASAGSASGDSFTLDRSVAPGSRDKYTKLLGNGNDTVTMMIYMCGTDLESRSGMATNDLNEILKAKFGDNVRVIVYTGGCTRWRNNTISSSENQVWRVKSGSMEKLGSDGSKAMTDPNTLAGFIQYARKRYEASRYFLILWDHGGGSVSGYGYDEKYRNAGSMTLPNVQKALQLGGVKFDFIGFDACLMATVETALMAADHADYLIASEETEPGIGWYYTDWMTQLGRNTSISTLDLGKAICDDFVKACGTQARGQRTTLSVVDLAELSNTVPDALTGFSTSITGMVKKNNYKKVSVARNGSREFAASTKIDQVDLADLADRLGTSEAKALAKVIRGAVKYNRAGSLTGAYGLSIYFPYRKPSNANKAANSASSIGIDTSYSECIRAFAAVEQAGQGAMTGTSSYSPYTSLSGGSYGGSSSAGMISDLLGAFLGGGRSLTGSEDIVQYFSQNALDGKDLVFSAENGKPVLRLTDDQWSLVTAVDLNLFYDDGEGYLELGTDNVFSWDSEGNLVGDMSGGWLTLNGQLAAYYRESASDGVTYGYIPVLLNGERAELLVVCENNAYTVTGARRVYKNGETDTVAKAETEIVSGSSIDLVFDYYTRNGRYEESYIYGDAIPCNDIADLSIAQMKLSDTENLCYTYRLTDIYEQEWWTNTYRLR